MATQTLLLRGKSKWAKLQEPDEGYGNGPANYKLNLYMDEESEDKFRSSGSRWKTYTDDDGDFITPKRREDAGRPDVFLLDKQSGNYAPFEGLIGNGSTVVVKIEVYDSKFGRGSRLESVGIDELVEYTGKGTKATVESGTGIKMPF